ncbi:hypothetical protein ABT364_19615 [Massilia sp. SR12]
MTLPVEEKRVAHLGSQFETVEWADVHEWRGRSSMDEGESEFLLLLFFTLAALQIAGFSLAEKEGKSGQSDWTSMHLNQSCPLFRKSRTRQTTAKEVVFRVLVDERVDVTIKMPNFLVELTEETRHSIQAGFSP